jgi:putative ABC transport system permease protein
LNSLTLILESLWHHRRAHAGAFLGAAVAVAAIVGALGAGDSVRASLDRLALARIGRTEYALAAEDRFFRSHLAEEMAGHVDAEVVTALRLPGVASTPAGARAGGIQVLGVEPRFWFLGREFAPFSSPTPGEAIVNRKLADRLSLKPGDEFLLHVGRPDAVPSETPLAAAGGETAGLRVVVRAVAREAQLGDFGLRPNQAAPSNAFVSLPWLAEQAGIPGRANVLLVAGRRGKPPPLDDLQGILRDAWTLEDAGLELREAGRRTLELRSSRIFLDAAAEEAALDAGHGARGVFAYFVNSIRCGQRETPYSFAAAPGEPIVPRGMDDAEILLTDWLADDLGAVPGDMVELRYFVPGPMRRLEERASSFRVRDIVPPSGPAAERDLVPDIPGLAGSETCSAWKPGFPIDLGRVRPKDEAYWKERRTAPKAFVTLAAAREMWANRFGRLTSVRYAADASLRDKIAALVLKGAPPSSMGIVLRPVRQEALRAGRGSTEFGSLFAGLSGFLVAAALLLAGLLFALGIEARAEETGTLLALGFPPGRVRRLRLVEGGIVALLGGVAGALLGVLYIRLLLLGLGTFWIGAIGTSSLVARVERLSLYGGAAAGTAAAFLAMAVAAFLQAARRPRELQAGAESVPEFSAVRLALRILAGAAAAAGAVAAAGRASAARARPRRDLGRPARPLARLRAEPDRAGPGGAGPRDLALPGHRADPALARHLGAT